MSAAGPVSPEAWRKVNDVFHRALDLPAEARAAFVDEASGGDPMIRTEVLSLLAAHERAAEFIEEPAVPPALMRTVASAQHLVGQTVGQYRIDRVIGEGGMGVVYLAEDLRLGRAVALKAIAPKFTSSPDHRERLRREARAAAALTHPGIATVYALEEFNDQLFIAVEYVPGETLRDELGRGPLGAARALDTALAAARALATAHDRGIVHRDLKPENVIRTPAGEVKILDFGLARMRDTAYESARLTDDGTFLGTPAYMSPEQIRGGAVDGRSDLFALGIVLYELVSGVHPFMGVDRASTLARILEVDPPRLSDHSSGTSSALAAALEGIVRTCLRKTPDARYRSAHELVAALEQARQGGSSPGVRTTSDPAFRTISPASPPEWWWQFHQGVVSAAYLALIVGLWFARRWIGSQMGQLIFLAGVVGGTAAAILRLHLWFTVRSYPAEWPRQRAYSGRWIRLAEILLVVALVAAGIGVRDTHDSAAAVFIGSAIAVLLAFTIIEPATTRAAFRDGDG